MNMRDADPMILDQGPSSESAITVRDYAAADADRWERFVTGCSDATFFHRIGWKDVIERAFKHRTHFMLAERAGEIVGVLPLAQVKSWLFGHSLVSLPFCVYGGVASTDPRAIAALHQAARALAERLGVDHLELRNRSLREPNWPQQDLYVTFRRALEPSVDANMLAIPRKQRAMVRKGIGKNLTIAIDPTIDRFFALYADNVHRHGTPPLPKRYFELLREVFGDDVETQIVLDPNGNPLSGVLSFYWRDEVLPYYAGDYPAARDLAANDFKYWALMRRATERGIALFDYGRSKRGTGSFDFKKNWGFEAAPLHYEYVLVKRDAIPQNNPNNPKYKALIKTWRRLPLPVANAIGPYITRHLG